MYINNQIQYASHIADLILNLKENYVQDSRKIKERFEELGTSAVILKDKKRIDDSIIFRVSHEYFPDQTMKFHPDVFQTAQNNYNNPSNLRLASKSGAVNIIATISFPFVPGLNNRIVSYDFLDGIFYSKGNGFDKEHKECVRKLAEADFLPSVDKKDYVCFIKDEQKKVLLTDYNHLTRLNPNIVTIFPDEIANSQEIWS